MPKFRVVLDDSRTFWDGVHRHEPGTILNVEKADYQRLLNPSFEPMDDEAKKDMVAFRAARAAALGKPAWAPPVPPEAGTLDPNDPEELRRITKGAQVVHPDKPANVVDIAAEIDKRVDEKLRALKK